MASTDSTSQWELVVGLEVHIQLNTQSKAFASEINRFETNPNQNISAVTLALPGTLPYLNHDQVTKAIKLGLAIGSKINQETYFDRKNYFYPDLPKGYQTTQDAQPICVGGQVNLSNGRTIRIHHIHMEEDAGKSVHDVYSNATGVDYNRAGTPLVELVTEPDFRDADEVYEFINKLRTLVQYIDISDAQMQEGSLRADVNLSTRPKGENTYGTRTEIKNLNSATMARKAVLLEFKRQCKALDKGEEIKQQTLDFDFATEKITPMRSKEDAHDYRYFADPDLPPLLISDEKLKELKNSLGILPDEMLRTLTKDFSIPRENASTIAEDKTIAIWLLELFGTAKTNFVPLANFTVNQVMPYLKENETVSYPLVEDYIIELIQIISEEKVSNSVAMQQLLPELLKNPQSPLELAKKKNLIQTNDSNLTKDWAKEVIEANPDEVKKYQNGKKGLIGFFMGQLMQISKGKANPKTAKEILQELLETK